MARDRTGYWHERYMDLGDGVLRIEVQTALGRTRYYQIGIGPKLLLFPSPPRLGDQLTPREGSAGAS